MNKQELIKYKKRIAIAVLVLFAGMQLLRQLLLQQTNLTQRNYGIAFGIIDEYAYLAILLNVISVCVLLYILSEGLSAGSIDPSSRLTSLGLVLLIGGACSNLFERIVYGYVLDYISLANLPVFNLADAAIDTGVILLILGYYHVQKKQRYNKG